MNSLFKNLKVTIAVITLLLLLFIYFGVFAPLKNELETTLAANFADKVYSTDLYLESCLTRFKECSRTLSDRMIIKNILEEYYFGRINKQKLIKFSETKFIDAAESMRFLLSAYRLTDNVVVAKSGADFLDLINENNFSEKEQLSFKILTSSSPKLIVKSLIINDSDILLGVDYFIYNINSILKDINSGDINYQIIKSEKKIKDLNSEVVVKYERLLDSSYWLKAELSKSNLYQHLNFLSLRIILFSLILLLIVIFIVKSTLDNTFKKIIAKLEEEVEAKKILSETDSMLEINNRSKFIELLKKEMDRTKRYQTPLSLIMFDIDAFKSVNDNYGHNIGDQILKEVVKIAKKNIRTNDLFARYGGDEFMIICPQTGKNRAKKLAERLRQSIKDHKYSEALNITCSFGVTNLKNSENDLDSFIKNADDALYAAKRRGKDNVFVN